MYYVRVQGDKYIFDSGEYGFVRVVVKPTTRIRIAWRAHDCSTVIYLFTRAVESSTRVEHPPRAQEIVRTTCSHSTMYRQVGSLVQYTGSETIAERL